MLDVCHECTRKTKERIIHSCPSVSEGDWFQDPPLIQNLWMLNEALCIKWCRTAHGVLALLICRFPASDQKYYLRLAEFVNVKPRDTQGRLNIERKIHL